MAGSVVVTLAEFRDAWPDLRDVSVIGVDLRGETLDWSGARLDRTVLLGCGLPVGSAEQLAALEVVVFSGFGDLPFEPYRGGLYSYDELTATPAAGAMTLDTRIGSWFASSSTSVRDALIRSAHDAMIDAAVARFVVGRRVVGVMGGRAIDRDAGLYRKVAVLGRTLARAGFTIATGGGPGVTEAANLGAWMAAFADDALDDALAMLAGSPSYAADDDAYFQCAHEVRARWPGGRESLGVPTWVYMNEPTSAFATHIAKYFTNSIREDGLLAIARSGVIYAPGGAGTEQEIFTDAAQNSLTLEKVRSPMIFFGRAFFEGERSELVAAVRRQAVAFGWADLLAVCDEPGDIAAFIASHDPDGDGRAGVERRRRHRSL